MIVSGFRYVEDLHLVRHKAGVGHLFILARDYTVEFRLDGAPIVYTVGAGMRTDFASIPKIVPKWIADKMGAHIEAAVVHDHMCQRKGPWSSRVAADVFLAAMEAARVAWLQRRLMYRAVVMFGPKWS